MGTHMKRKHRIMRGPGPCSQVGCNLGFLPLHPRDICEDIWLPHQPTPCCKASFCFGGAAQVQEVPQVTGVCNHLGWGFNVRASGYGVALALGCQVYPGDVQGWCQESSPGRCLLGTCPNACTIYQPPHQEVNISRASQKWWLLSISLPSP